MINISCTDGLILVSLFINKMVIFVDSNLGGFITPEEHDLSPFWAVLTLQAAITAVSAVVADL